MESTTVREDMEPFAEGEELSLPRSIVGKRTVNEHDGNAGTSFDVRQRCSVDDRRLGLHARVCYLNVHHKPSRITTSAIEAVTLRA